jgi:hypothetical protein
MIFSQEGDQLKEFAEFHVKVAKSLEEKARFFASNEIMTLL